MTVSVRFATTSLGDPESLPKNVGTLSPGDTSTVIDFYISHDGTAAITNCAFYVLPYTGIYLGTESAQTDYDTVIGWGDAATGGFYINQDYAGGFGAGNWDLIATGNGDSLANAIALSADAINIGSAIAGQIDASGEAHIEVKVVIPGTYASTGRMYLDLLMYFSATS